MQDSAEYRVIDRKKFAVVMAVLLSVVAVGVWVSLDHLAEYAEKLEELAAAEPLEAAATLTRLMRTLAILNGIVLSLLAILIIWHGWRGWRTASMPPKGSWILAGQRTWTGKSAMRIAQFTITVGALLGVLALVSSLILWSLGDTLRDQTWKGAYIRGHEVKEFTPCGSAKSYWVSFNWAGSELVQFYESKPREPYQPIYVEFRGHLLDEELDGFAASYDGLIRISEVYEMGDDIPADCEFAQRSP